MKYLKLKCSPIQISPGYTLLEMTIVVALISTILAVAFPTLSQFVESRRISANAQEISDLLSAARQQAVSHNERVRVCWNERNEGTTNVRAVRGYQIMHGGFIAIPALAAQQDNLYRRTDLSGNRAVLRETVAGRCMVYETNGRTNNKAGSFFVCRTNDDADGAIEIRVDVAGRPRLFRNVQDSSC